MSKWNRVESGGLLVRTRAGKKGVGERVEAILVGDAKGRDRWGRAGEG